MRKNVSDNLLVKSASGSSRKYCLTMSAMSYAWCSLKFRFSPLVSIRFRKVCMRDRTPDFRKSPTWSLPFCFSHCKASSMHLGIGKPVFCSVMHIGTPKRRFSAHKSIASNVAFIIISVLKCPCF